MKKYVCMICGYTYDEAAGIPDAGIAPGTTWESLPDDWICPLCGAPKSSFKEAEEKVASGQAKKVQPHPGQEEMKELSFGELSAVCSNLARGCEKQYLARESELFTQLAEYFRDKAEPVREEGTDELLELVNRDLSESYPDAHGTAADNKDRGALRALVWSEKVTRMLQSLLNRYEKDGGSFIEKTNVYICEICGFIYVGDTAPDICPVCKVPKLKIAKVQRG